MVKYIDSLIPIHSVPASAVPCTMAVHHSGWMPVIRHPERARFLQEEIFPRKIKATPQDAIAYAARVMFYRQVRAAQKRRKLEALSQPHWLDAAE